MYDICFMTYNCPEPETTNRYVKFITDYPLHRVYRVNNVKGIHQAHIEAASRAKTSMFYVVDYDAEILPTFKFNHKIAVDEEDIVHVWRAINPVNGLEYGWGGVKLLPTEITKEMNVDSTDMTTSIGKRFKAVDEVSNITRYNTDPLGTWRSAFRECAKLASKIIPGQVDQETEFRLDKWINYPSEAEFANFSRAGATAGKWYGLTNAHNKEALKKVNDYEWLEEQFNQYNEDSSKFEQAFNRTCGANFWKDGFIEVANLTKECNLSSEQQVRINELCFNEDFRPFAEYKRAGASAGKWFAETYKDDNEMLSKMYDNKWLAEQFDAHIELFPPETFK